MKKIKINFKELARQLNNVRYLDEPSRTSPFLRAAIFQYGSKNDIIFDQAATLLRTLKKNRFK